MDANVRVNSNIDAVHADPDDHRRATVTTVDTPQGAQAYVALEADAVDGYKFIGWYRDFKKLEVGTDGNVEVAGTPVPGNRVTGDEMFAGYLYTAVYQKTQVYKVVYHFPDGSSSTVELDEGDPPPSCSRSVPPSLMRAASRSSVPTASPCWAIRSTPWSSAARRRLPWRASCPRKTPRAR